ncbi:hypothetical protein ZEAMMB73_Zm00001d034902 [Zea mays]|uniref:Uncharacterized protein n=1 Tax=Zea mays TaxID=4577 RepID=A0A1D6LC94_MAIZE|nr:hypothetical protein ZEAMMB73_Zm00001d034902 [Zea mays]
MSGCWAAQVGCRLGSKRIGHLLPPWGLSTTPKTYNKLATQITLPPSYIAPEDTGKISGTIWTEEVVLHSTTAASRSGEAMQRKMAQPFEAKHQGNQLPVPLVPIIGKGVLEEEVMVSHTWGIAAAGSNTSCFTRTEADPVSFINMVTPPTIEVHRHSCIIHSVPSLPSATHGSMRRMTFFSLISPVLRLQLRHFEYMRDTMVKLPHELETARINELLGNIQAVVTPEMNQTTIIEEFDKGHQLEEVKTVNEGLEFIFDVTDAMQDIFHYIKPGLLDPPANQFIQTEDDDVYPSHQPQKRQKTSHIAAGSSSTTPSIGQQFPRFLQEDNTAGLGLSIYNGRTNMEWCSKRLLECQFSNEEELQLGIQILKEDWEAHQIFMSLPLGNAKNFILTCISRS